MSFTVYPETTARNKPSYFSIQVNNPGFLASEGFMDHVVPSWYGTNPPFVFPPTLAGSLTKERSNMRYDRMVRNLSETSNPNVINISTVGANATTEPTSITITVRYDRPEFISTPNELFGSAHPTGGDEILTDPLLVLERHAVRAMLISFTTSRMIYDPTTTLLIPDDPYKMDRITAAKLVAAGSLLADITALEASVSVTADTIAN